MRVSFVMKLSKFDLLFLFCFNINIINILQYVEIFRKFCMFFNFLNFQGYAILQLWLEPVVDYLTLSAVLNLHGRQSTSKGQGCPQ